MKKENGKKLDMTLIVMLVVIVIAIIFAIVSSNKNKTNTGETNTDTKVENETSIDIVVPDEQYEYTSKVTLPEYKDFVVSYYPYEMTDEEYQYYVDYYKDMVKDYEDVTTGKLADGDISVISYNGWLKENTVDEGETQEYDVNMTTTTPVELELGQNQYIEGFESGLVGKNIGDVVKLELKFPEEYGDENYNGKEAIFEVTIVAKRVYKDEVSNEKVKEVLIPMFFENPEESEFSNFEEFEVFLKKDMEKYYVNSEKQNKENAVVDSYLAAVTEIEYSKEDETKIRSDIEKRTNEDIEMSGVDKEEFATSYYGFEATEEKSAYDQLIEKSIADTLKYEVVMYNLAKKENISIDETTVEEYVQYLADFYTVSTEEIKNAYYFEMDGQIYDHMNDLYRETLNWKVSQMLVENAKFEKIEVTDSLETLNNLETEENVEAHDHDHDHNHDH